MKVSSPTLNIVRVIAMTGIVADHYFQASGNAVLVRTGLQWGGVFLMVFFSLSAYLFGMKWVRGNYEEFDCKSFLLRRGIRIFIPLWLTLPIVVLIEYLTRQAIDVKAIVFNIAGLGWFKPFSVAGHLWYITLMLFLYLMFVVFSRVRLDKLHVGYWLAGYVVLASLFAFGGKYFSTFSAVAPVVTVFLASSLFYKGDEFTEFCRKRSIFLLILTVLILALSWWMYLQGWHDTHKAGATFSSFSAGFALFLSLLTFIKATKDSRIIKHFADISYEVYLVHLPLLPLTAYCLRQCGCANRLLILPAWLLLTWLFAFGIHKTTQRLTVRTNIKKKYE